MGFWLWVACMHDPRIKDILDLKGDLDNGTDLYATECSSCHGSDGHGATGPDIFREPAEDKEIAYIILDGSERMPAFGESLSNQEIADILAWIHSR